MSSLLAPLFKNVFIKLSVVYILFVIWRKALKYGRETGLYNIFIFYIVLTVVSVILSIFSIDKLYPYGLTIDTMVIQFFVIANILVFSYVESQSVRTISTFVIIFTASLFPVFYILHFIVVGGAVNQDSFIVIFQTDFYEAMGYLQSFVSPFAIFLLLFFAVSLFIFARLFSTKVSGSIDAKIVIKPLIIILVLMVVVTKEKSLFSYPFIVYGKYQAELAVLKKKLTDIKDSQDIKTKFSVKKKDNDETYLVLIGESLNKHHMGVYGYPLNTTPYLSSMAKSGELTVIKNSYANYTGTMSALSHALTEANQKNEKEYIDSVGLIDVFNKAGFDTIWLGNQPLSNSYDMTLGALANLAHTVKLTFDIKFHSMSHKGQKPDGILIPQLKNILSVDPGINRIIFMHFMGSHTNYCKRYPENFNVFKIPTIDNLWKRLFAGGVGHSRECYDNSVLYNDYVVNEIINLFRKYLGKKKAGALIYFSDHADDVMRGVGHSSSNFSYDMLESPTVLWTSNAYKRKYLDKVKNIDNNKDKLFSNDFIFDTTIGLSDLSIDKNIYCPSCDLTRPEYELKPEDALTMHRKKHYIPPDNSN